MSYDVPINPPKPWLNGAVDFGILMGQYGSGDGTALATAKSLDFR